MQHNEAQPLEDVNRDRDDSSLGRILKRARESQELSLEQVCAELRIERHLLEALENDRFDDLGPPVFAKGYLKQYGQRLGLSYEELLARYNDAVGRQDVVIEPSKTIKLRDERQITVWVIALVALALVGVVLFIWWSNESVEPVEFPPPADSDSRTGNAADSAVLPARTSALESAESALGADSPGAAPEPVAGAGGLEVADEAGELSADTAGAGMPAGVERRGPEAPGPVPLSDTAEPAAARTTPAPESTEASTPARAEAPPRGDVASAGESVDNGAPSPVPPGAARIELDFSADSWTEVTDARGERLVYGLMQAGERRTAAGMPPFSVLLGNADGVRLAFDGEPFAIPAAARRGELAEFTLGESGN